MHMGNKIAGLATTRPRIVAAAMAGVTLLIGILAAAPTLWTAIPLPAVQVDTDPENMLSRDEAVRVFHNRMKGLLNLHDMVVVGVVNEAHPEGVFNPESLARVYELTEYAKTLRGEAIGEDDPQSGVVEVDLLAPSVVDNIEPGGVGVVKFEWLMPEPPATQAAATAIRDKAKRLPFLNGTLVSEDGRAIALYLPLTSKDLSYQVSRRLQEKIATFNGDDQFHITGLPVAEDTFGVEMFIQMAVSAPLAMLVIFLLLLWFFRKLVLIVAPLIIAMVAVITTMGLLIISGQTIHIMSSMIPIFIMPIAVLDSVHILSEFFDRYPHHRDRRRAIREVMDILFVPMLFTSLTSTAGFASLALTPIPPVQVFGIFVAIGVMSAWFWTIVFVPAYVMFIPERKLQGFGYQPAAEGASKGFTAHVQHSLRDITWRHPRYVLAGTVVAAAVALYGIFQIQINDNPTRWFKASHPIRVADRVLNEHFGGTYMAYLALQPPTGGVAVDLDDLRARLETHLTGADFEPDAAATVLTALEAPDDLDAMMTTAEGQYDASGEMIWDETIYFLDLERQREELFKQPETLEYIASLQEHLETTGVVGKSNSVADIVKTVHRELFEGDPEAFRIPDTARAVGQTLITYESSHRPHDLYHFITPDYRLGSIWVQLKSGDNRDMARVVAAADEFTAQNPPPFGLEPAWFGLTYINVVWQEKMVAGMLMAFVGSFLVVLLMMAGLFRSGLWGLLSMIPLTVTIGLIYGLIGLVGKDYDMPVAVLSSLTLGLAVDFAIHFLARARAAYRETGSWADAHHEVFGEPARAILRNVAVIAIGFLPLLAAPLVPYNTVGVFLASILLLSGAATLLILPALIRLLQPWLFPQTTLQRRVDRWTTSVVVGFAASGFVAVNVHDFTDAGPATVAGIVFVGGAVGTLICAAFLRMRGVRSPLVPLPADHPAEEKGLSR